MNTVLHRYDRFQDRHIGPDKDEQQKMLDFIGAASLDDLIDQTIPLSIRLKQPLQGVKAKTEVDFLTEFNEISSHNKIYKSYIGMGYYDCVTPSVILRNLMENPGWYTQYTPYQAEIAQGRLESLLNFQTMVMDLTGMEIANASLLDEGTGAAEAMHLMFAHRSQEMNDANVLFVSQDCYPQTIDVLITRSEPLGIKLLIGDPLKIKKEWDDKIFGAILQYPNGNGEIPDYDSFCEVAHKHHATIAVAADLLSLVLLKSPGEFGADIVFGSSQRFGVPLGYGGPHAAFFAAKEVFKRQMPGRIIGVSVDSHGNPAYRMALQTREQHIRRDKATSNICTAQALLANMSAMYAVYHGPKGLKIIAERVHGLTSLLAKHLEKNGFKLAHSHFFDTLKIHVADDKLVSIRKFAEDAKMNFRYFSDGVGISLNETTTIEDVNDIVEVFVNVSGIKPTNHVEIKISVTIPSEAKRTSSYLTHPVFNTHHSETEMLRYLKYLENRDLSLTHSTIIS